MVADLHDVASFRVLSWQLEATGQENGGDNSECHRSNLPGEVTLQKKVDRGILSSCTWSCGVEGFKSWCLGAV
jgi:hypothetical protein